jgi:hypothetical protein
MSDNHRSTKLVEFATEYDRAGNEIRRVIETVASEPPIRGRTFTNCFGELKFLNVENPHANKLADECELPADWYFGTEHDVAEFETCHRRFCTVRLFPFDLLAMVVPRLYDQGQWDPTTQTFIVQQLPKPSAVAGKNLETQLLQRAEDMAETTGGGTGLVEVQGSASALAVYQRMEPIAAVRELGEAIAKSGMFGCQSVEQGKVFALECLTTGIPPLTMAKRYHVIGNQLSMRADFMLAEFHRRGGRSKWLKRNPEAAAICVEKDGDKIEFALTWEEAKKEPFPYKGSDSTVVEQLAKGQTPTLKAKWATPRSRMQMLAARVVSDAIRAIMPEVNEGRYTPEEFDGDDWGPTSETAEVKVEAAAVQPETQAPPAVVDQGEVIDAEFQVVEPAAVASVEQPAEVVTEPAKADSLLLAKLAQLSVVLLDRGAITQANFSKALAKRGAKKFDELTQADAESLYANLVKLAEQQPASNATTSAPADGPCDAALVAQIKGLAAEADKMKKGSSARVKEWVRARGAEKLSELRMSQARELCSLLTLENLETFFADSLEPKGKN